MAIDPSFLSQPSAPRSPAFGPGQAQQAALQARTEISLWAGESFSFWDLVDIVNPLQHIPGLSTLYREWSGDDIGGLARIAGGAVLGGVPGIVAAVVNTAIESRTGRDIGAHALALFDEAPDATVSASVAPARFPADASPAGKLAARNGPAETAGSESPAQTRIALERYEHGAALTAGRHTASARHA